MKNTKAVIKLAEKLKGITSLSSPKELWDIPYFVEEIKMTLDNPLLSTGNINYLLRKQNNALTANDRICVSGEDKRKEKEKKVIDTLTDIKNDANVMVKVDAIIDKYITLCKRNVSAELAANFNADLTADELISWLAAA